MNRLTASVSTAAVAVGASLALLAPSAVGAAAANVVQQVRAVDLGPWKPWIWLQDDQADVNRPPGIQEVSPFADTVRFNGSLHLSVAGGQQAQAAHHYTAQVPLSTVAAAELSYDSYVRTVEEGATGTAANLQLPMVCRGAFTTLSFQPQLATDSRGRAGVVPDTWQHFESTGASLWRTSRALPTDPALPAGSDSPLSTYAAECDAPGDGVVGLTASVGRLGDAEASLDTYVDNLTANGTTYDFAVEGLAQGLIVLDRGSQDRPCHHARYPCPRTLGGTASGFVSFTDPADGPGYRAVGTRLTFSNGRALAPGDLTVTANGRPLTLTAGPGGTLTGVVSPTPGLDLNPNGTYRTALIVTHRDHPPRDGGDGGTGGRDGLKVRAELLATGYEPLRPTGVRTSTAVR
ncbi:hypothetical protein [Streptomyces sp. NBC_00887]|uniref:hypothetical protein n=1 Tax=Streptomyces sp. NBC_00887 TaxID=2975859 RepID=UPI003865BD2F|nr:hypothetical protein OG844_31420 [Streptomyces sp. NBC_00887]